MFCSKCGSVNPDRSTFCSTCGQPFPASAQNVLPASAPQPAASTPPAYPAQQAVSPHWRPVPAGPLYAGFWLRVVAHIVDGLIVGIPVGVVIVLVVLLGGMGAAFRGIEQNGEPSPQFVAFFVMFILICSAAALVGSWLYYAYFESSNWQGTPGKKMLNLYVTDMFGSPVSFGRASGRFFAKMITGLIPLGIGYILAGITEKKQALHDMIASCLVLRRY